MRRPGLSLVKHQFSHLVVFEIKQHQWSCGPVTNQLEWNKSIKLNLIIFYLAWKLCIVMASDLTIFFFSFIPRWGVYHLVSMLRLLCCCFYKWRLRQDGIHLWPQKKTSSLMFHIINDSNLWGEHYWCISVF